MKHLRVTNFWRYQHYGDHRRPPWVKHYREFWIDDDLAALTPSNRLLAVFLTSYVSEYEHGVVRLNIPRITERVCLEQSDVESGIKALQRVGFVEVGRASKLLANALAERKQNARPTRARPGARERGEEEKEKEGGAARKNGPPQEPSPYARHHGPSPKAARTWIDNGAVLEVPDVALRSVIADEFKITDDELLDELVDRAGQVKARRSDAKGAS